MKRLGTRNKRLMVAAVMAILAGVMSWSAVQVRAQEPGQPGQGAFMDDGKQFRRWVLIVVGCNIDVL